MRNILFLVICACMQNTQLNVLGDEGLTVITAQARESESEATGYSFVHCQITGTGSGTFLGRAWKTRPRVVFAFTSMANILNPAAWSLNFHPERSQYVNCYSFFLYVQIKSLIITNFWD